MASLGSRKEQAEERVEKAALIILPLEKLGDIFILKNYFKFVSGLFLLANDRLVN